jgi:hypothetical protein
VIRANPTLAPDPLADLSEAVAAPGLKRAPPAPKSPGALIRQPFPSLAAAPVPAWARASGRAGEGDPLFAAGAGLALLDAFLRADPPAAGTLRARLALQSAAASAKILRIDADPAALRDLRFAVGDAGPAARLLQIWRELAARPASTPAGSPPRRPRSIFQRRTDALAETLREQSRAGIRFRQPARRPPPCSPGGVRANSRAVLDCVSLGA